MKNIAILSAVLAVAIVGVIIYLRGYPLGINGPEEQTRKKIEGPVSVNIEPLNDSGESGNSIISETEGGLLRVKINLSGAESDEPRPAHIHKGTCSNIGEVKYGLVVVRGGSSESLVNISLQKLAEELPLVVNVHKSIAEISTSVACGEIRL